MTTKGRRVVVTGLGIVSPLGATSDLTWSGLKAGKSGIRPISQFDATQFDVKIAGECRDFQADQFVSIKDQKKMDRFIHLALGATAEAWNQANLKDFITPENAHRFITYYGVGMGGIPSIQTQYDIMKAKGPSRLTPFFIPQVITNMAPGQISMLYGLKGRNFALASACSSGAHAIGEAALAIAYGAADVAVCGGSEAVVCEMAIGGFAAMRALSRRNETPEQASRPWDVDRDGFVLAEGAATLILEDEQTALQRGAKIIAVLSGYGASSDAYHMTTPAPEGAGAQASMRNALEAAGLNSTQIDYINAHGTSTGVGDIGEISAIRAVFEQKHLQQNLLISSTKSMIGHTLGAAGAIEAAISILALQHQTAPPTLNLDKPDAACEGVNLVPHKAVSATLNHVLSNSFGFGGTNATLIFSKH